MKSASIALAAAALGAIASPHSVADTILYYDSVNGGTADALDRLDSETDSSFVDSSSATTTLGSNAVFSLAHGSDTHVQGLGDGTDKSFRFGSSAGGSGTMSGTMRVAHMENGPYIEMSFTAAQDMILDELSFKLWNNSLNGSYYGARDAGLFVKISSDDFTQFGESFTSPTSNGNQGTVTFTDTREVAEGDLVVLRIAFTDRTRAANDNAAATRIGAIDISASPGPISDKFRIITYNIHGGEGPDGEGTPISNLTAFRDNFMKNEDILCLQEVNNGDCWTAVQDVFFDDYPHYYRTTNQETNIFSWPYAQTSIVILSKHPIEEPPHSQLIQIDPQGDKWERHAQHVEIKIGGEPVHIFHFHNTYNFNDNDWEYEKLGMEKFRDYVYSRLNISSLAEGGRLVMLGDFNLLEANVSTILPTPANKSNGRDHIYSVPLFTKSGHYTTVAADLSDHPAVWASLELAAPSPNPMTWASAPENAGTTSMTMTATAATDPNGVEYYFTNTSFADGSHDSGWQSNPVYIDTGLSPGSSYTYTVKARDQSQNLNESSASTPASAYTDDGDSLPNDWELLYFPSLLSTSGGSDEDWDNDGLSDTGEWIAGTIPTDPLSHFRARVQAGDPGEVDVTWDAVAGKTYRIYRSATLDDPWEVIADELPAVVPECSHSVTIGENDSACFYRVEVIQ